MTRLLPLFVLLAMGCAPTGTFTKVPGQDQAMQIVWRDLYGMLDDDPPEVEWIDGGCWGIHNDTCGFTWIGWKVQVAVTETTCYVNSNDPFDCGISASKFSHELMHYATYLRTGDVDAAHNRGDWNLADWDAVDALQRSRM